MPLLSTEGTLASFAHRYNGIRNTAWANAVKSPVKQRGDWPLHQGHTKPRRICFFSGEGREGFPAQSHKSSRNARAGQDWWMPWGAEWYVPVPQSTYLNWEATPHLSWENTGFSYQKSLKQMETQIGQRMAEGQRNRLVSAQTPNYIFNLRGDVLSLLRITGFSCPETQKQ